MVSTSLKRRNADQQSTCIGKEVKKEVCYNAFPKIVSGIGKIGTTFSSLHWHWSRQVKSIVPLNGRWTLVMMQGPELTQSISTFKNRRFKGRYKGSHRNRTYADLIIECVSSAWWRHQMGTVFALLALWMGGIHRSPVNSPHKCQWRGPLMFSLNCA